MAGARSGRSSWAPSAEASCTTHAAMSRWCAPRRPLLPHDSDQHGTARPAGGSHTRLDYKAARYRREPGNSELSSTCGTIAPSMPLNVRSLECSCGTTHDRGVNAAKNILAAGLAER
ncbi:zinc ribbon domain-containing protein [Nonomuraea glycinis]|uniref:zinc ribbon domain-containing protein n=1 Tax=Nonomuraea glycinis TaxID=2047744 RepID=UPI00389996CE